MPPKYLYRSSDNRKLQFDNQKFLYYWDDLEYKDTRTGYTFEYLMRLDGEFFKSSPFKKPEISIIYIIRIYAGDGLYFGGYDKDGIPFLKTKESAYKFNSYNVTETIMKDVLYYYSSEIGVIKKIFKKE